MVTTKARSEGVSSRPSGRQELHGAAHWLRAIDPEGDELAATQLVRDDHL